MRASDRLHDIAATLAVCLCIAVLVAIAVVAFGPRPLTCHHCGDPVRNTEEAIAAHFGRCLGLEQRDAE